MNTPGLSPGSSHATLLAGPTAPLLPTRVLDLQRRKLAVERHFQGGRYAGLRVYYLSDLFHTLVNCPWYRFYLLFVFFYVTMYALYAAWYNAFPGCVFQTTNYWHALWFSVITSATIGYGYQSPDPNCYLVNLGIMAQVLTSLLMQASLLGLVFARISNSAGRSATIRFSKCLSVYQGADGCWRLAFRVANMRQHQVLQPEVRLLLLRRQVAHPFASPQPEFIYSELPVEHVGGGKLWLGVPSLMEHRMDGRSPLAGMDEAEMRAADMEIIVLLDGVDESTSRALQARHSYLPSDIRWQHAFDPCIQRRRSGKLGVDFSLFDATQPRPQSAPGSAEISRSGSPTPAAAIAAAAAAAALPINGGMQAGLHGRLGEQLSPFDARHQGILPPV